MTREREQPTEPTPTPPATGKEQYAWLELSRATPPKRSPTERLADFLEVYGCYDEATAREQAHRCVQCPEPMCVQACPLETRIPEWLLLTAEGQFLEAAALSRATSNMPEICARICPQDRLCEGACILDGKSDPVAIGAIERFLNEYAFAHGVTDSASVAPNGRRVAVVGSGPGGLACADELAKRGYAVTVFEAQSVPGGLLVNGIPAFKLEKGVVERRIDFLRHRGVVFRTGVWIGKDITLKELQRHFEAVFLACGAQQARPLDIPGADLKGVLQALPFLVEKNSDLPLAMPKTDVAGRRVVVLGGGDTAMDCLRTALRCGAKATVCLYRRDEANMPGSRTEYDNAVEEGAEFQFLTNPIALEGNGDGQVTQVRCVRMQLGAPDATGRRRPLALPNSEFRVLADVVLVAYGFDPTPFPADSDFAQIARHPWGGMVVDEQFMTRLPGVFAGGDLIRGPALVVEAVRDARQAALAIDRYLACRPAGGASPSADAVRAARAQP